MILKTNWIFSNLIIKNYNLEIFNNICINKKTNIIKNKILIKNIKIVNKREINKISSFNFHRDKNIKNKFSFFKLNNKIKNINLNNNIYINNNINELEINNKIFLKEYNKIFLKNIKYKNINLLNNQNIIKKSFLICLNNNQNKIFFNELKLISKKPRLKNMLIKNFKNEIDLEIKNLNIKILNNKVIINFDKLNFFEDYEIYYFNNNEFYFLKEIKYKKDIIIETKEKIFSIIPKGVY